MDRELPFFIDGIQMPVHCETYTRNSERNTKPVLHYHDYYELVLCTEGICKCRVGTDYYHLAPGDMLFVCNNIPHQIGFIESFCTYSVVKFLPAVITASTQTFNEYAYELLLGQKQTSYRILFKATEEKTKSFASIINEIMREWDGKQFGYELGVRAHIIEVILHILRVWKRDNPGIKSVMLNSTHGKILQDAIKFIENNYTEISEASVAKSVGVSIYHLSRLFKNGLNISFSDFVRSVRLSEAERQLLTTSLSITEISLNSGFASTAYFIKTFKEKHGITPLQWRKNAG